MSNVQRVRVRKLCRLFGDHVILVVERTTVGGIGCDKTEVIDRYLQCMNDEQCMSHEWIVIFHSFPMSNQLDI